LTLDQAGYWRPDVSSNDSYPCNAIDNTERCVEGFYSDCSTGYTGPLCDACDYSSGFVSNGSKKCGTCKSPEVSFLLFLMLFMVNMLYTVYFIRNTRYLINAVIKHEDEVSQLRRSTYFGLLNNYGQIATLIFSFNFISSNEVSDLAMAFGFANPVSTLNLSMECMYEFFGLDTANFYYYTIILTVILPNTRVDNYRDKNDQMESKTQ